MKLIVGILLLFSPFLSQAQGVFDFKTKEIELKNLKADETPTTVTFGFKNTGKQPIIISRVAPVTTLVKATWNEQPVAPGKTGTIKVSFPTTQISTNFNYTVTVYSNASPAREQLRIRGNIVDNPKHPDLLYKLSMDSLKFKSNNLSLREVHFGEIKKDTVYFFNSRQKEVSVSIRYKPSYITAVVEPQIVKPGKKGMIIVSLDADKRNDYGYVYDNVILSIDNDNSYKNRLSISAHITEDFSKLTEEELANAPVAVFEKNTIEFGEIKPGEKANCDFVMKNNGKSDLIIRKTKASCGCTAVTMGETILGPGQSTTIRATFDSTGKSGRQYKSITVITNDPQHPETLLTISGNITNKK